MLALAGDPSALAARRRAVRAWYERVTRAAVRRAEAALAAAAAIADAATAPLDLAPRVAGAPRVAAPLAAGAPRAVAEWLEALGVPAVHDRIRSGAVTLSWHFSPGAAGGCCDDRDGAARDGGIAFAPIVRVVRDPLDHVRVLADHPALFAPTCPCAGSHGHAPSPAARLPRLSALAPHRTRADRLRAAALFWLEWHGAAAARAAATFRLEDLDGVAFLAALGVARSASAASVPAFAVATAANATDRPRLRWSDLADALGRDLAAELRARAEDLGYRYP